MTKTVSTGVKICQRAGNENQKFCKKCQKRKKMRQMSHNDKRKLRNKVKVCHQIVRKNTNPRKIVEKTRDRHVDNI